jgi:hypothetical protein
VLSLAWLPVGADTAAQSARVGRLDELAYFAGADLQEPHRIVWATTRDGVFQPALEEILSRVRDGRVSIDLVTQFQLKEG